MRFTIVALLQREGWSDADVGRILLAASEALSNAVDHGSPTGGRIQVRLTVSHDRAELTVHDQGRPGGPTPRLPRDAPPASSACGRGLMIMERLCDELALTTTGTGTEITAGFRRLVAARAMPSAAVTT